MYRNAQLDKVLSRLNNVRKSGAGYTARCPAHEDNDPSLSISTNDEGTVLLHCFAGCTTESVLQACRLEFRDLYEQDIQHGDHLRNVDDRDHHRNHQRQRGTHNTYAPSAAGAPAKGASSASRIVMPLTIHLYEDGDGNPLFRVCRFITATGRKRFQLQRPDGYGTWINHIDGVERVLYHLPDLLRAVRNGERVYVVEGEKNADDLARLGLVATTNPQGAMKWNTYGDGYTRALAGADVVVLYDNDPPGQRHRDEVTRSLYGTARSVRVVDLPNIGEGEDVSDWLERGGSAEELERLADTAPEWSPELQTLRRAKVVRASDVTPERVEWLWENYIPRGRIILLEGDPGLAKSTILLDIAARISAGSPLPGGRTLPGPADVLLLSHDDGIADTIVPRLIAAGADRTRVHIISAVLNDAGEEERAPELPTDMHILAAAVRSMRAALVIIDPLAAFLSSAIDPLSNQAMRRVTTPLVKLAAETGAAIAVVHHCARSAGLDTTHKESAPAGIIAPSHLGMLFAKDPGAAPDSGRMIMAVTKSNLGPIPPSLSYRIETDETQGCGRIVWEGTSIYTAGHLRGLPMSPPKRRTSSKKT